MLFCAKSKISVLFSCSNAVANLGSVVAGTSVAAEDTVSDDEAKTEVET